MPIADIIFDGNKIGTIEYTEYNGKKYCSIKGVVFSAMKEPMRSTFMLDFINDYEMVTVRPETQYGHDFYHSLGFTLEEDGVMIWINSET